VEGVDPQIEQIAAQNGSRAEVWTEKRLKIQFLWCVQARYAAACSLQEGHANGIRSPRPGHAAVAARAVRLMTWVSHILPCVVMLESLSYDINKVTLFYSLEVKIPSPNHTYALHDCRTVHGAHHSCDRQRWNLRKPVSNRFQISLLLSSGTPAWPLAVLIDWSGLPCREGRSVAGGHLRQSRGTITNGQSWGCAPKQKSWLCMPSLHGPATKRPRP
jgi:hypothetical protein